MFYNILSVMSEWCSLVAGGRRLEEVCVWVTAVVDRLVTRNTHFTDIRYFASLQYNTMNWIV